MDAFSLLDAEDIGYPSNLIGSEMQRDLPEKFGDQEYVTGVSEVNFQRRDLSGCLGASSGVGSGVKESGRPGSFTLSTDSGIESISQM